MPAEALKPALPLAVSMGDPAGIGLEIALMSWRVRSERAVAPFYLWADPEALQDRARALSLAVPIAEINSPCEAIGAFNSALPVRTIRLRAKAIAGAPDVRNAAATILAIEHAVKDVAEGKASAIVTCPIAKATLSQAGFQYPGHTEFLGALAESYTRSRRCRPVMMLASDELRVVPLTVHIALSRVPGSLSRPLIFDTVKTVWDALKRDFGIAQPRIAISGLNPHAGEEGTMGREEIEIIAPAIAELVQEGLSVSGPHPADTMFHAAARSSYDAAIAMFHDQALIAIKTIAFEKAVNVTLGLPFVRTSPDHGTAFGIAARGIANPESFIEALLLAGRLSRGRAAYPSEAQP
jgi:4-hydroxythreonine-4-phosphate dehydrogenase